MAKWQRFVAYRKKVSFEALYKWRSSVIKSVIITKQEEEFVGRDEMFPPPSSPLPTILSSISYPQNCVAHIPICSHFTPPYCKAKAEKEVRDLLNIVQVESIEDLKCLL